MDRLIERLRADAAATERATQMIADAKSARNQAAEGGEWPGYQGVPKENTPAWQAASEIERLTAENERLRALLSEMRYSGANATSRRFRGITLGRGVCGQFRIQRQLQLRHCRGVGPTDGVD